MDAPHKLICQPICHGPLLSSLHDKKQNMLEFIESGDSGILVEVQTRSNFESGSEINRPFSTDCVNSCKLTKTITKQQQQQHHHHHHHPQQPSTISLVTRLPQKCMNYYDNYYDDVMMIIKSGVAGSSSSSSLSALSLQEQRSSQYHHIGHKDVNRTFAGGIQKNEICVLVLEVD